MTTQLKVIAGAVALAVLLVFGFCWKHDADARADGRIAIADSLRNAEKARGDSIARANDSLSARVGSGAAAVLRVDTLLLRRVDTVTSVVTRIVKSGAPDSVKVVLLVAQIDTLKRDALVAARAGDALAFTADSLRRAFGVERQSWQAQVATANGEITLLKRQSRHWGLGVSLIYGAAKLPNGSIAAVPALGVGLVYRY